MATVHPNYTKASDLIILSAILGIINIFISPIFANISGVIVGILTIIFIIGTGLLIRQGIKWVKYVFSINAFRAFGASFNFSKFVYYPYCWNYQSYTNCITGNSSSFIVYDAKGKINNNIFI